MSSAHKIEEIYSSGIFFYGALPLIKVIAADVPKLAKSFERMDAVFCVSALDPEAQGGAVSIYLTVAKGEWDVSFTAPERAPDVELAFKSIEAMNGFFKGKIAPSTMPKMRGLFSSFGKFKAFLSALLKMASLLGASDIPADEATKALLVKCYFYLLSSGISRLNKLGHPEIHEWALKSPDRVYAWAVDGYPELSAYMRVKAGNTKAGRGVYKRAMPFFTLRFNNLDSALGILLSKDDMLGSLKEGRLIMDGAPEFGGQIGGFMLEVGALAK